MSPYPIDGKDPGLRLPEEEAAVASIEQLPPRIVKHAARKSRKARYYAIALLWSFILLTVALIVWGYRHT